MQLRPYQADAVQSLFKLLIETRYPLRYNPYPVLKTLPKAVPRTVKAIFLCLSVGTPMGRVRHAVTQAARLSTCFHTLPAPAENREKKPIDWSIPL